MSLTGICYVCSKPAMYSCSLCGKIACIDHYDKPSRICTNCMAKYGDNQNDDINHTQEILF